MHRLLILTFLVLFSSCGKDEVIVFEGSAERHEEERLSGQNFEWKFSEYNASADYSVQFTIIDEKVHYIVTLKNRKCSTPNGSVPVAPATGTPLLVYFSLYSKCYDKFGQVLFDFNDSKIPESSDKEGIYKGVLNNETAETVRKVSKIEIEIYAG